MRTQCVGSNPQHATSSYLNQSGRNAVPMVRASSSAGSAGKTANASAWGRSVPLDPRFMEGLGSGGGCSQMQSVTLSRVQQQQRQQQRQQPHVAPPRSPAQQGQLQPRTISLGRDVGGSVRCEPSKSGAPLPLSPQRLETGKKPAQQSSTPSVPSTPIMQHRLVVGTSSSDSWRPPGEPKHHAHW